MPAQSGAHPGNGVDEAATLRLCLGDGPGRPRLAAGVEFDLPDAAAAHVKVRRLQPGAALRLFDGGEGADGAEVAEGVDGASGTAGPEGTAGTDHTPGLDWPAVITAITRSAVRVRLGAAPLPPPAGELPVAVRLAFCMPANERVDALVEKATELGAAALLPLMSERSVLRLQGERAERRRAHWQAVAAAACEQCGRARVPRVHAVQPLAAWLSAAAPDAAVYLLSTDPTAPALASPQGWGRAKPNGVHPGAVVVLSGPEGGFSPAEEAWARAAGCLPVSLGPRTLRADTAPLAALAWMALQLEGR
jgi:16S rRNA (uracil1498-N3)-methyltransferase